MTRRRACIPPHQILIGEPLARWHLAYAQEPLKYLTVIVARAGRPYDPPPVHGSCAGSLIVHLIDGTAAGCTLDEEPEGCAGLELRHEGDPTSCVRGWGGCNRCGIHER